MLRSCYDFPKMGVLLMVLLSGCLDKNIKINYFLRHLANIVQNKYFKCAI